MGDLTMEQPKVWAITLKGMKQDPQFGFNKYAWATDSQAERIMALQYDEKNYDKLVMLGDVAFHIKDIENMRRLPLQQAKEYISFDMKMIEPVMAEYQKKALQTGEYEEKRQHLLDKMAI